MLLKLTTTQAEGIFNSLLADLGMAGTRVEVKDFTEPSIFITKDQAEQIEKAISSIPVSQCKCVGASK